VLDTCDGLDAPTEVKVCAVGDKLVSSGTRNSGRDVWLDCG
jgi:hypothetical protein